MNRTKNTLLSLLAACCLAVAPAGVRAAGPVKTAVSLTVEVSGSDGSKLLAAVANLEGYDIWGVANREGVAVLQKIPYEPHADYRLVVSMLGYKTAVVPVTLSADGENSVRVILQEESLAMDEVVVVAESIPGRLATSSRIGRQAIEHLQAVSLRDVLQLLPGNLAMYNQNLNTEQSFRLRTLNSAGYNTFGSSVLIDGVPIPTNATMGVSNSLLGSSGGVDLRSIGVDDVESVEVIRGIASAEYGDVAGGTMIVHSKMGVTGLIAKAKIMPGITQVSVGKGFGIGKAGTINASFDYAHGRSDPRYLTDTYDRTAGNLIHSVSALQGRWVMTNSVRLTGIREWSGADPDEPESQQEYYRKRKEFNLTLAHSGKINVNRLLSRTLNYNLSYTNNHNHAHAYSYVNVGGDTYLNATEEGTYADPMVFPMSYSTRGGTRSNPVTYYAQVSNQFYLNAGNFHNNFNLGAEFRSEGNEGIGHYNVEGYYPAAVSERLRRYKDYPYLTQVSAYAEDNIQLTFGDNAYPQINAQVGLRWSLVQPGRKESLHTFSPRMNLSVDPVRWLALRFGYGTMEKAPSLSYLYPNPFYYDFFNVNVSNSSGDRFILYSTRIFDLENAKLKPMRNTKYEAGFDIKPGNGMKFSVVGFWEKTPNAFSYDTGNWVALTFDTWSGSDIWFQDGVGRYNPMQPTVADSVVLVNVSKPGNSGYQRSRGVEFDFDLGRIKATNTAFYLSGAYVNTTYRSNNKQYVGPGGKTTSDVYLVYPTASSATQDMRRFTTALRVVQHIPSLRFILSATAQFILYEYERTLYASKYPEGYLRAARNGAGDVEYVAFTQDELLRAESETSDTPPSAWVTFEGYRLKDEILTHIKTNQPQTWPVLWCMNLRVTKEITDFLGFSFYLNNVFFHQPWQTSSNSFNPVERNSNLFSYGLEMSLRF